MVLSDFISNYFYSVKGYLLNVRLVYLFPW